MISARWVFESITTDGIKARCRLCGRVAISKDDLLRCPRGCERKEIKPKRSVEEQPKGMWDDEQ